MATSTKIVACFTCVKETGRVKCEGCSKNFCVNHFQDHLKELSKRLDEVEATRDLFRQSLTEKINEPRKHTIIEQIDQWENESINKIRQAARKARQILLKHTTELNTKMEDKLNKLTEQLRQSRQNNAFFEADLNQWTGELAQMKDELTKPSNITIRQDRTPLVTNITVDIADESRNTKPSKRTDVTIKETNNQEELVTCSFCNENFPSPKVLGEHLMMCGNKTDECPNCKQFIRRAIFAYHLKNECADPDVPTTDDETHNKTQNSGRLQLTKKYHSEDEILPRADRTLYEENSRVNFDNARKNQRQLMFEHYNRGSDRSRQSPENDDDDDDDAHVPCEYCNESIPWKHFEDHMEACQEEQHSRQQKPTRRRTQRIPSAIDKFSPTAACMYCSQQMSPEGLAYHQLICQMSSRRPGPF